ncbi:MAG: M48 family metallopeptidase [Planctomycetota bacterium]
MKRASLLSVLALLAPISGCTVSPETGKSRIDIIPDGILNDMGLAAYAESTSGFPELTSGAQYDMVRRVTDRITAVAYGYDYEWEVKVLDAPDVVNAFALPGGKIAVYTGLLRVAENEDQLAAVIGHEIAHVTEEHGEQRMTTTLGVNVISAIVASGAGSVLEGSDRDLALAAIGLGTQYGVELPFSRSNETDADYVGLIFMERAGFRLEEAPKLWARMGALSPDRPPEWQSTHPDPSNREQALRDAIPEVRARVAEERRNGQR